MKKQYTYIHMPITLFLILFAGCFEKSKIPEKETESNLLHISMQQRVPSAYEENSFVIVDSVELWNPLETAVVISDMWDKHWCPTATARVAELAPVMNDVITLIRNTGVTIIHAPSDCMNYYKDYPGRREAMKYYDKEIAANINGVTKLPSEADAVWPIDDSDEGCESPGASPYHAWSKQIDGLAIENNDLISDNGAQIVDYFRGKGIKNVIIMGVHTNMCIMHRTFGLRVMIRMGMNVVLMRDMTDLMYNPERFPYTTHWNGLNLMVEYIEKYICPTITSSDFTSEAPFVFAEAKKQK